MSFSSLKKARFGGIKKDALCKKQFLKTSNCCGGILDCLKRQLLRGNLTASRLKP